MQAVVLAPTRELAVQIAEHVNLLGRYRGLRFAAIYGGQPIERQLRALRQGVHVLVATPGRLMDHMRRRSVDSGSVRFLVLDEADQMLQMGFQEDVEYIISHLPDERVTALFSATMPKPILNIVHRYMKSPEILQLSEPRALTVPEVEQVFYEVPFPRKFEALCRVLDVRQPDRAIVFCATKRMVDEAVERLQARGYVADGLHGDVSQPSREKVLRKFREGKTEVLVATDVAARGLDVPDVSLVVNFDIPPDPEYYVHRIGRTGRLGRAGEAITFVNPRELSELRIIERATGARIRRAEVPTAAEAEERGAQLLEGRLLEAMAKKTDSYRVIIEHLLDDHDPSSWRQRLFRWWPARRLTEVRMKRENAKTTRHGGLRLRIAAIKLPTWAKRGAGRRKKILGPQPTLNAELRRAWNPWLSVNVPRRDTVMVVAL